MTLCTECGREAGDGPWCRPCMAAIYADALREVVARRPGGVAPDGPVVPGVEISAALRDWMAEPAGAGDLADLEARLAALSRRRLH
jgi:hypothetical protein